ncbi:Glycosyltransferase involved in cell wall bisynthesis [Zunongwangia mangrovi]|uniref:Glycosyltransferase involved in cell wall bisynthesis n=1 Tax=Zunongwangia mangrovi TaxID=1334022 RepID=A0A1I1LMZ9_9FLAO|nr:glycosyltransferase family 4 protein [Zunongwangia mangrovi]SFC74587.1 Glycosyltransferase involved in cell wall bisynthesis [Zunongwangia mangrovi]
MTKKILYIGNDLRVDSFTATYISFLSKMLREEGFKVKTASAKNNKLIRLTEMLCLIMKFHSTTDIVLIDTYGATNFYYAYLVGRLSKIYKIPYVPILHGGNLPERLDKDPKFSKRLFGNAFVNIAPSNFLKSEFESRDFDRLKLIPNSIDLQNYPYKERSTFRPKLLWVRRFQKRYNPKMAIKVLELLSEEFEDAELCMIGPEKDGCMQECKRLVKKKDLNVKFTGKLKKKVWADLSKEYDFFINSTTIDNTPISVIESMSLGLPIISTNVGGMPVLIDHLQDGVLVDSGDSEKMYSEIKNIIENPDIGQAIAFNARKKAESFGWINVRKDWLEVINNVG